MQDPILPIHNMERRHRGLTQAVADSNLEALRVCLDRHHAPPVSFEIVEIGHQSVTATLDWDATDDAIKNAWTNEKNATEDGAYACVLAAVELLYGLVSVGQAEEGTGSDYYVAPPGASPYDFEERIRLEVSGVDRGNESDVRRRLRRKLAQASGGRSDLPAIAGVVGFREKLILIQRLEES